MTATLPRGFNLGSTIFSHGWCALPPFRATRGENRLGLAVKLPSGKHAALTITRRNGALDIAADRSLGARDARAAAAVVRSCLRLDEDLSEFHAAAKRTPRFQWAARLGAGRLLRAPSAFEDAVKMLCTTNCSWALTEAMIGNLCARLGGSADPLLFPAPEAIADASEKFLRREIRSGYRSPYLREFARRVIKKNIDPEAWRTSGAPAGELFDEIRSVKGIGPYAAGNLLKLAGRYDRLGIDSWCRKKFSEIHRSGRRTTDRVIERFYEPFGRWRGLFFWLDVTREWYTPGGSPF